MTTPTQLDNGGESKLHEIRVSSIVKVLTTQRDSANNAVVNALVEKMVLEAQLAEANAKLAEANSTIAALREMNAGANQQISHSRIVIANLQQQIDSLKVEAQESETEKTALREKLAVFEKPETVVRALDFTDRSGEPLPENLSPDWVDANAGEQDSLGHVIAVVADKSPLKEKLFPSSAKE